jgi:hypothetical protein
MGCRARRGCGSWVLGLRSSVFDLRFRISVRPFLICCRFVVHAVKRGLGFLRPNTHDLLCSCPSSADAPSATPTRSREVVKNKILERDGETSPRPRCGPGLFRVCVRWRWKNGSRRRTRPKAASSAPHARRRESAQNKPQLPPADPPATRETETSAWETIPSARAWRLPWDCIPPGIR